MKIQLLQGSKVRNYLESKERLFLETILSKMQNTKSEISKDEENVLENIFKKYNKFL